MGTKIYMLKLLFVAFCMENVEEIFTNSLKSFSNIEISKPNKITNYQLNEL